MTSFIIGLILGATLGCMVMALVAAGARGDECAECMERRFPEPFNVEVKTDG